MSLLCARQSFGVVVFSILAVAVRLMAQVTTAEIVGSVFDNSGAVISNAKVTITHRSTGEVRSMQTNATGEYVFTLLPIGTYTVTVESGGFREFVGSNVTLTAGDRIRVDAKMEVGEVSEQLVVSEQVAGLQTDSSTVGASVSSTSVEDLPTNGRNFVTLVQIGAGMNESNQSSLGGGGRPDDRRQTSTVSANGQNDSANNFLLDGMDNNERAIGTVVVKPSIDGLAEVQVETSMYPASVGRAGGAVINEITKSGSNQFHGTVYEFLRNDLFDAKNFFNVPEAGNPLAGVKPEYRQNQFGASFGGPIKKDKLFFFADYEAFRRIEGETNTALIPTACELGRATCNGITQLGNFSDMTTETIKSAAGVPFPNNVIPASLINSVSQDYAALYPTLPASACQGTTCLFTSSPNATQFADTGDARIDYQINAKNTFYGRYSINQTSTFTPPLIPPVNVAGLTGVEGSGANFNTLFPSTAYQRQQAFTLGDTHIFGPSLVLQLGAQVGRYVTDSEGLNNGVNVNTAFGGPTNINTSQAGSSGLAMVWFLDGDYNDLGDQFALPTKYYDITYQYSGNLSWTKGTHSIKMGSSLIHRDWSVNQQLFKAAYLFTGGIGPGNDFAAMLEGDPLEFLRNMSLTAPQYRANEIGTYIQDDWRATRWLTLNLGLRWDVFTPMTEKHNALSDFDPTNPAMLASGMIQVAGQNGVSAADGFKIHWGDFQPSSRFRRNAGTRHGAAWRLRHNLFPGHTGLSRVREERAHYLQRHRCLSRVDCGAPHHS
jgi:Carboxypeptidase regulatory-like domain